MARVVAFMVDGAISTHADSAGLFNYATLCGLDGEENAVVPVMPGAVIDCPQCIALWKAWSKYRRPTL